MTEPIRVLVADDHPIFRDGLAMLLATVDGCAAGALSAVAQSSDGVSLAPKVTPAMARVDWGASAMRVDRLVRACTPAPGAWTTFRDRRVKLGPVTPVTPAADVPAGQLVSTREQLLVGTGTGPVALGSVQPEGKPMMPAIDWARGARVAAGASFG